MFAGIVEEAGRVMHVEKRPEAIRLAVEARKCAEKVRIGDSLAVNGCCLTIVGINPHANGTSILEFDLLEETWRRTNLQFAQPGTLVNLERPLRPDAFVGGHFVTGHVDGLGTIRRWERLGQDWVLDVELPPEVQKYAIFKGSVAIDGISLTIAEVHENWVRIWIIPHTYEVTNLRERKVGDQVNVEADLIGKYVERFLSQMEIPGR